ncbi:DVU_1556 family methyltransferase [Anaerovorax odorimutans]|uniref:DVU_1556 family methyltransferase n=1 Tax=Anaerovorax odorimutans TaxID=109327 RepID=UPI000425B3C2|nr:class I SAM-dependent methyltransferase [Anaerovorax odorimutans]
MSIYKPGEFRITDQAMEVWNLPKGAKVLDIGCGEGETVEYLEKKYEFKASGIDLSMKMIKEGRDRNPNLDIQYGDGEFLDAFSSYSFDGVMMECALSLINLPDEALHEAFCVLKKGGRLFLSDLYIKNPDKKFVKALQLEADKQDKKPNIEDVFGSENKGEECQDCGEHEEECAEHDDHDHDLLSADFGDAHNNKVFNFRSSGRFLKEPFIAQLKEIGYTNIEWKDCSIELDNYVAEKILNEGSLESCFCKEGLNPKDKYKTGYFMLTAEKPIK